LAVARGKLVITHYQENRKVSVGGVSDAERVKKKRLSASGDASYKPIPRHSLTYC